MLKKYGIYFLCFILAGVAIYFYLSTEAAMGNWAAEKAKNKILAQAAKEQLDRETYYRKLYEIEAEKRVDAEMGEDLAVVTADKHLADLKKAQDEIALIKSCPDQVIALNFTLTQCREQYARTVEDMGIVFNDFQLSCDKTIGNMKKNIVECEASATKYSELYANMTANHIKYVARVRRNRIFWVGAGVVAGIIIKSL